MFLRHFILCRVITETYTRDSKGISQQEGERRFALTIFNTRKLYPFVFFANADSENIIDVHLSQIYALL